jgi:peptide/nickel transport system substrate-binding protein
LSRREFIRYTTLLGLSAGVAYAMAGVSVPAYAADTLPFPAADPTQKRAERCALVTRGKDGYPATYSWTEMVNQTRPILESMFLLGNDNIVRPCWWNPGSPPTT